MWWNLMKGNILFSLWVEHANQSKYLSEQTDLTGLIKLKKLTSFYYLFKGLNTLLLMLYCSWMLYHSANWLCEEHLFGKFTHIQRVNQSKPGDSSSAEYPSQLVFDCISPILFEAILHGEIIFSFSFTKKPLNHDIALTVSCRSVLRVQDAWFLKWSDAGVHQLQACRQLLLYVLLSICMYTKKKKNMSW